MVFSKVKLYCWTWVGFMFQEQNTHRDDMKSIYVPNCDVKRSVQNVVVAPAKFQNALSSNPTPRRPKLISKLSAQAFHLLWAVVTVT
jgi:hypothetical protein